MQFVADVIEMTLEQPAKQDTRRTQAGETISASLVDVHVREGRAGGQQLTSSPPGTDNMVPRRNSTRGPSAARTTRPASAIPARSSTYAHLNSMKTLIVQAVLEETRR